MAQLKENPHLASLLTAQGITIDPNQKDAQMMPGFKIVVVGDTLPEGTIVGFEVTSVGPVTRKIRAVVYDEAKEGQDDALSVLDNLIFNSAGF